MPRNFDAKMHFSSERRDTSHSVLGSLLSVVLKPDISLSVRKPVEKERILLHFQAVRYLRSHFPTRSLERNIAGKSTRYLVLFFQQGSNEGRSLTAHP